MPPKEHKILSSNVQAAFSLLPESKARKAIEDAFRHFRDWPKHRVPDLAWADFERNGTYLRGGVSSVTDLSTRIAAGPADDPDIRRLADRAGAGDLEVGTLELAEDGDRILWFVPHAPSSGDRLPETILRGLCIPERLFVEILSLLNPDAGLTPSEGRTVFQIVSGHAPREAAERDGLSTETKRAQLKSACFKLHCSGQTDLVRKVLGQMIFLLSVSDAEGMHARIAEDFVAEFLADNARLTTQRLANGRLVRFLECGPSDGQPILMIHGMMWPIMLFGCRRHLEKAGLRLIVPLRRGHLEVENLHGLYSDDDLVAGSMEDIALFIEQCLGGQATILGNSLGAVLAIGFANRFPQHVARLILLSINLTQTAPSRDNRAGEFYESLNRLSTRRDLFRQITWQYKEHYAQENTCREILDRLFGASQADLDVLCGRHGEKAAYRMFSELYRKSVPGMAEDFVYVMQQWQDEISRLHVPTVIIHGARDPLTPATQLRDAVHHNDDVQLVTFADGGHFVAASDPERVWPAVAQFAIS